MKEYQIIGLNGKVIATKKNRGDKSAKSWMDRLISLGIISGIAVQLQRRIMSDADAAKLPPFASGKPQTAWVAI